MNGNIILIKGTGIEKLQGEFCFPKLNILDRNLQNKETGNFNIKNTKEENITASRAQSSKSKGIPKNLPTTKNNSQNDQGLTLINNSINTNVVIHEKNSILPAGSSFE